MAAIETRTEPMTHEEAVARIVDAIVNPPPPMHMSAAHIPRLRQALFAITAPAKLLEELGGDLAAIKKAGAVGAVGAESTYAAGVPLDQQVAAWQAMALRISEEKAHQEKRLRTLADEVFGEIIAANEIEPTGGENVAKKHDRFWSAFRTMAQFFEQHASAEHGADYTFDEMYSVDQAEG